MTVVTRNKGLKLEFDANIMYCDYFNVESLVTALKNIEVVICTISGPSLDLQFMILEAAKKTGIRRFFPSEFGPDPRLGGNVVMYDIKKGVLNAVISSGIEWTVIAPGLFTEYLYDSFFGFDLKNHCAILYGSRYSVVSFSCIKSVGEYVAESINHPLSKNAVLTFASETKSYGDIIQDIELATNIQWGVIYKPVTDLQPVVNAATDKWKLSEKLF